MSAAEYVIKFKHRSIWRRFTLQGRRDEQIELSFIRVREGIGSRMLNPQKELTSFCLFYIDAESDHVLLDGQEDLAEALKASSRHGENDKRPVLVIYVQPGLASHIQCLKGEIGANLCKTATTAHIKAIQLGRRARTCIEQNGFGACALARLDELLSKDPAFVLTWLREHFDGSDQVSSLPLANLVARHKIGNYDVIPPGGIYFQKWTIRNSGQKAWPNGITVKYLKGDIECLEGVQLQSIPPVVPGCTFDLTVPIQAPKVHGEFAAYWMLATANGLMFGDVLSCQINVHGPKEASARASNYSSSKASIIAAAEAVDEIQERIPFEGCVGYQSAYARMLHRQ